MSEPKIITRAEREALKRKRGLGDVISSVATPIAATLGLPCVDPTTQKLRPESGCAKRKAALNQATDKAREFMNGLLGLEIKPSTEPKQ